MSESHALFEYGVSVVVIKARPQSTLTLGQHFEVRSFPVVLGRALDAGVRLADNTVSREHARLEMREGQLFLVALSDSSKVWVDQVLVNVGERVALTLPESLVQLGGVLLRVHLSEPTAPFQEQFDVMDAPAPRGLLHIEVSGDGALVTLDGVEVQLHRGPAMILRALARQTNTVFPEESLLLFGEPDVEKALDRNLNQLVTYIRNGLKPVLMNSPATRERVMAAVRAAELERMDESPPFDEADTEGQVVAILRRLIRNHRRFGYSLRLSSAQVTTDEYIRGAFVAEGSGSHEAAALPSAVDTKLR